MEDCGLAGGCAGWWNEMKLGVAILPLRSLFVLRRFRDGWNIYPVNVFPSSNITHKFWLPNCLFRLDLFHNNILLCIYVCFYERIILVLDIILNPKEEKFFFTSALLMSFLCLSLFHIHNVLTQSLIKKVLPRVFKTSVFLGSATVRSLSNEKK